MAKSTGPLIAAAAITTGNQVLIRNEPMDWKRPLGLGVVATIFAALEKIPQMDTFIAGVSWIVLVTIIATRPKANVPSPAESFIKWVGW